MKRPRRQTRPRITEKNIDGLLSLANRTEAVNDAETAALKYMKAMHRWFHSEDGEKAKARRRRLVAAAEKIGVKL